MQANVNQEKEMKVKFFNQDLNYAEHLLVNELFDMINF